MLQTEHLISLIVLMILVIAIIMWLYLTIRSIHYQKRIENYVIAKNDPQNISIFDKIGSFWNRLVNEFVKKLKQMKVDKLLYHQTEENMDSDQRLKFLSIKILVGLGLLITYLLLSLFQITDFSMIMTVCIFLIGFYIPNMISIIKQKMVKKKIETDLLKAISLMNNSFQSGKSILQAIQIVSKELDGPISIEFDKIYQDMLHGLSFETAFSRFQNRVEIEEVKYITSTLSILNKTGGNIMEVFSSLEKSFYTRRKLEMELKSTIASSRLVFQLLVFLPIFLWITIGIWNPDYFTIFFQSTPGILLFSIILCIYLIYIIVIRNIMKVEKY